MWFTSQYSSFSSNEVFYSCQGMFSTFCDKGISMKLGGIKIACDCHASSLTLVSSFFLSLSSFISSKLLCLIHSSACSFHMTSPFELSFDCMIHSLYSLCSFCFSALLIYSFSKIRENGNQ